MARVITPINTATDTFNTWVTQANDVIDFVSTEALSANNNANGGFVTGNSQLFGIFTANTIAVYDELRGGNVQSSGTLTIGSDVEQDAKYTWGNSTINAHANSISFNLSNSTVAISLIKPTSAEVTDGFYYLASDSTWVSGIERGSNPASNRLATWANGTAIDGESTLTYDGSILTVAGATGANITAGELRVDRSGDVVDAVVALRSDAGENISINFIRGANTRWQFQKDDTTDDINFVRYNDSGALQDTSLSIDSDNGDVRLANNLLLTNESAGVRVSDSAANAVLNDTDLTLQNSTVTFVLSKPTAGQVSDGGYFLNADGTWSLGGGSDIVTQCNTAGTAREIDSWLKTDFRSAEYQLSVRNENANGYQITKALVIHDDNTTNAYISEYGTVSTNNNLGTMTANCNTTHCVVYWTNSTSPSIANTRVTAIRTAIANN